MIPSPKKVKSFCVKNLRIKEYTADATEKQLIKYNTNYYKFLNTKGT